MKVPDRMFLKGFGAFERFSMVQHIGFDSSGARL